MGYYEDKKKELEQVLYILQKEKIAFEHEFDLKKNFLERLEQGINQMAKEKSNGFPWLAKAYDEFFQLEDAKLINYLKNKTRPAIKASEEISAYSKLRRQAEYDKKIAQYLLEYYEYIYPQLIDLKEEVSYAQANSISEDYEQKDPLAEYLSKEEYKKLSPLEKNQLALDRFWQRPKSKILIGRLYERYIGYLYEQKGYDVDYVGILKGYEDLGRDLICKKGKELIIIQCKNWSKFKTIYEKHIFQFFGTVFQFKDENPKYDVTAMFYTSTKVSELAKRFAGELHIVLKENYLLNQQYPSIKCNISKKTGDKIYHLPFDQQYDKTKIELDKGELYCRTVKEAEDAGFRRAFKYVSY